MWDSIVETVVANGAWAVLFCFLLIFELKDSRKREQKYQDTITTLGDSLTCVKEMAKEVGEIKRDVILGFGLQDQNSEKEERFADEAA